MNNTIFEAVIFDMDGVVIDTRKPIEEFWFELGSKHKIKITPEMMEKQIHGCPARQSVYALFTHLSTKQKEELLERCDEFETSMWYEAMPGVKPLLLELQKNQIPAALVTSSLPPKVAKVFSHLGLHGLFDTVVTSDLVEKGKPDPACYRMAAEKLGKETGHCIVFEDALSGIIAASGAGMFPIGVGSKSQAPLLRQTGAWEVIANFEEIRLVKTNDAYQLSFTSGLCLNIAASNLITR